MTAGPTSADKPTAPPALGFLTVLQEASGYVGGYLVTNLWGRPLEFRLTSAVQPNRVQQILYGDTLLPHVCSDLIGKTLVDKAGVPAHLIFTDREAVLELRLKVDVPVVYVATPEDPGSFGNALVRPSTAERGPVRCHPGFPGDAAAVRDMVARVEGVVDLAEPFTRIREAVAEARKMGVSRAA
jgi:hypothetical protein